MNTTQDDINKALKDWNGKPGHLEACDIWELADNMAAVLDNVKIEEPWICIATDGLPPLLEKAEDSDEYLIIDSAGMCMGSLYQYDPDDKAQWIESGRDGYHCDDVTHYRKKPRLPEGIAK